MTFHDPPGPMTEKQRRLEAVRRSIVDVQLPLQRYFSAVAAIWPSEVTPEMFRGFQESAAELAEALRREQQRMFDLLEFLSGESTSEDLVAELRRLADLKEEQARRIQEAKSRSWARRGR